MDKKYYYPNIILEVFREIQNKINNSPRKLLSGSSKNSNLHPF